MNRTHLSVRAGLPGYTQRPLCFSRGSEHGTSSADLGQVDCARCLAIVEQVRRQADAAWAYHMRIVRHVKARIDCPVESLESIRKRCRRGTWGEEVWQGKYDKAVEGRGRREHRLLLLWLKAAFNAVDCSRPTRGQLLLPARTL